MEHPTTPALDLAEATAARGASGKRISLTDLKNEIADVRYMVPGHHYDDTTLGIDHPLGVLTLCFLTTRSGFVLVGKSAAVDPKNFNAEKGELFAYEDALRQMWPLMAFAHKQHELQAKTAQR